MLNSTKTLHLHSLYFRLSSNNEFDSPFSSRPSLHRSPSGSLRHRTIATPSEQTNLAQMKKFSTSSPAVFDKNFDSLSPVHWPEVNGQNFTIEQSCRVIPNSISPLEKKFDYSQMNGYRDNTEQDNRASHSISPKLSKSAQEKLRKHKELKTTHSFDFQNFHDTARDDKWDSQLYNDPFKNNTKIQNDINLKYSGLDNKDGSHEHIDLDLMSNRLKDTEQLLNGIDRIDSTKEYEEITSPNKGLMMPQDRKQFRNFNEEKSEGNSKALHSPRKTKSSAKGRSPSPFDNNNNNYNGYQKDHGWYPSL